MSDLTERRHKLYTKAYEFFLIVKKFNQDASYKYAVRYMNSRAPVPLPVNEDRMFKELDELLKGGTMPPGN